MVYVGHRIAWVKPSNGCKGCKNHPHFVRHGLIHSFIDASIGDLLDSVVPVLL
jgi:hypothetical protein